MTGAPCEVRILVVEDDTSIREVLQRLLERAGYQVITVGTAIDAHRIAQTEPVHLVLTDISLPGSDGLQLIAELRASHPRVPIIAMTGADVRQELGVLGAAIQLGACQGLEKPFSMDDLLHAVRVALKSDESTKSPSRRGKAG